MSNEDIKEIDKKLIQGHEYDGIKELDNPLPGWWLFIFYATIIFSAGYYYYYEMGGGGESTSQELQANLDEIKAMQPQQQEVSGEEIAAMGSDPAALESGKAEYIAKCAACHGQLGEGSIGPNLTDDYWLHGSSTEEIYKVVKEGVAEKGMPPWGEQITPEKMQHLTVFIKSLAGTNPPNAKEPQGTQVSE